MELKKGALSQVKKIFSFNFLRLVAFYPFLLPVWTDYYFRVENTSYIVPTQMSAQVLSEQKRFFFLTPDPIIRSRMLASFNVSENPSMAVVLDEILSKEKNPQVLSDILAVMKRKGIKSSNLPILKKLMSSEISSSRAYAACLYLDVADSPNAVLDMLANEKSVFVSNLVWEKLLERRNICSETLLANAFTKIPAYQHSQFFRVFASVLSLPENNKFIKDIVAGENIENKIAIAAILGRQKDCADVVLAKFAESKDPRLRMIVAQSLFGDGRLEFLLKLSDDNDSEVRRLTLNSLSGFGIENEMAINAIIKHLADEELLVRNDAEKILVELRIGDKYLSVIQKNFLGLDAGVASAVTVLGDLKYTNAAEDIRSIMREKNDVEVRKRALYALGKMDYKVSAKDCSVFATDKSAEIRRATAFALGLFGDKETFEIITKLAMDKDAETSAEALLGISRIGDPFFLNTVITCIKRVKENYIIRSSAAKAGSTLGVSSKELVKELRRACLEMTIPAEGGMKLFDSDQVRGAVAWTLAEIGRKDASFAGETKNVLAILQTPIEKQTNNISSSEFLIDCARQAQCYFEGIECPPSEITPLNPTLTINTFEGK